jgi:hypothetical protein
MNAPHHHQDYTQNERPKAGVPHLIELRLQPTSLHSVQLLMTKLKRTFMPLNMSLKLFAQYSFSEKSVSRIR